jgi:hypothetical protein
MIHMNFRRPASHTPAVMVLKRPERSLAPAGPRPQAARPEPTEIAEDR